MMERDLTIREFIEAAAPLAGMRWEGLRRVWRSVRGSVRDSARAACARSLSSYLDRVRADAAEARRLRLALAPTISRFHRATRTFEVICREALDWPAGEARAWCAGCACGEEPYTLALFFRERVAPARSDLSLAILATDVREDALDRARGAVYRSSSLASVPTRSRERWFEAVGEGWRVSDALREGVTFRRHDLLEDPPPSGMAVVFCRNLAFTYFGDGLEREALSRLHASLRPGGLLAIGDRERYAVLFERFEPVRGDRAVFRRRT